MKTTYLSIAIAVALIGGAIALSGGEQSTPVASRENVSIVDGKQIIEINVRGGYSPRQTIARANAPTVIRFVTKGTFDCSAAVSIPAVGYRKNLPQTGTTDVVIPPQAPGTTLQGLCAMGMYDMAVNFE